MEVFFMKIKKLLTLLIASSMVVACGTKPAKSSDAGNSENQSSPSEIAPSSDNGSSEEAPASSSEAPQPSSSEAPASSSEAKPSSSEALKPSSSEAPASSSEAPASSSEAPSSSAQPSSSEAPVVLSSISVTAPTKVDYTTDDTELDLTGMVVTANYSDGSTQVIAEGYTVSAIDFSIAGTKVVTVTYQGKTDSFSINVTQAKPTDWTADDYALFDQYIGGYGVPFFYGPDLGLGDITWQYKNSAFYAQGSATINTTADENNNPLDPVKDLLVADGFTVDTEFSIADSQLTYELSAQFMDENNLFHNLSVTLGAYNKLGRVAATGTFRMIMEDTIYYSSWEDLGLEPRLIEYFELGDTFDIPDLPDGGLYSASDYQEYTLKAMANNAASVPLYIIGDADYALAVALAFLGADWMTSKTAENEYLAIEENGKLQAEISYNDSYGEVWVVFGKPDEKPQYVQVAAEIFEVSPYAFSYNSNGYYFVDFEEELGEGETLEDLLKSYMDILEAYAETAQEEWVIKADATQYSETLWYAEYACPELSTDIEILAFNDDGEYGVQINASEFIPFPALFAPYVAAMGLEEDTFNVEQEASGSIMVWAQIDYDKTALTFEQAIMAYAQLLLDEDSFGFKVLSAYQDVTMSSGDEGGRYQIANDEVRAEFYAFGGKVQIALYPYEPAPESAFVDAVIAELAEFEIEWDDEDQSFGYANYRVLGDDEDLNSVVQALADRLFEVGSYELDILLDVPADETDQYPEATIILFCDEGSVEIAYGEGYGDGHAPVLFITIRTFDTDLDIYVNAVAALTGVTMALVQEGVYGGQGIKKFNQTLALSQYAGTLMQLYVGANLLASSLGFSLSQLAWSGNNIVGIFDNNKGYQVQIYLLGDANKNYTGYYNVYVILPTE